MLAASRQLQASLARILAALAGLGGRRLAILGAVGVLVFASTGLAGYLLSRAPFETLYAGLDRQDVSRIGSALRDAAIAFDVSADGATVFVTAGQSGRARMLLAEKGLPHTAGAGYELFDKLGSLGLTSFMQDVTRVRALEGELGRTILTMQGVRAARVHLVMPDEGSFRRSRQPPSASVVLRTEGRGDATMARAIRHLVASSVAGMTVESVTVLTTDGQTLASGSENDLTASGSMLALERNLSDTLGDNIRRTLAPYLGVGNLQVSVATRLNTDRRQTNETIFNPDSRVERSVRTVRETQTSQNASSQAATSADRNIPGDKKNGGEGKQSNEENQKREELTNYEVSSKSIATVSGGYAVERMDIALLVNSAGLGDGLKPEETERRLAEIRELASAAAGLRRDRGDTIKVSAVVFRNPDSDAAPTVMSGIAPVLLGQTGTVVNAFAAVASVALVLLFGARPLLRLAARPPQMAAAVIADALPSPPPPVALPGEAPPALSYDDHPKRALQRKLETAVASDEDGTAALLKRWIREGNAS